MKFATTLTLTSALSGAAAIDTSGVFVHLFEWSHADVAAECEVSV